MKIPLLEYRGIRLGLIAILFAPSLVMMLTQTSSMAVGLLLASLTILFCIFFRAAIYRSTFFISLPIFLGPFFLAFFIFVHYLVSAVFLTLPQDNEKFLTSLVAFWLITPTALVIAASLKQLEKTKFLKIFPLILYIFLSCLIFSILGIDFFGNASSKPTFLFSEPSHLSITIAPFIIYYVKTRAKGWLASVIVCFIWALIIQNLTMMIVLAMALFTSFRISRFILLAVPLVLLFFGYAEVDYFSDRFNFSLDNPNGSALVYMQGWENALLALNDTAGWGVGFQQFGIANQTGDVTAKLREFNMEVNLFDGGSTATKLLAEFGIFGVLVILIISISAIRAFSKIKKLPNEQGILLFASCVNLSILIELFVRGVGYFSPGIFIYITMFFYLKLTKLQVKEKHV
jgi:hypothetical protein